MGHQKDPVVVAAAAVEEAGTLDYWVKGMSVLSEAELLGMRKREEEAVVVEEEEGSHLPVQWKMEVVKL